MMNFALETDYCGW